MNNAGIVAPVGAFWELDPDDWWRVQEVNLRGAGAVHQGSAAGHGGPSARPDINVVSGDGTMAMPPTAYCSSKAAFIRLTDTLAVETNHTALACLRLALA